MTDSVFTIEWALLELDLRVNYVTSQHVSGRQAGRRSATPWQRYKNAQHITPQRTFIRLMFSVLLLSFSTVSYAELHCVTVTQTAH